MTVHPLGFDPAVLEALNLKAGATGGTATITGGGTIALQGYTLTVPATGTALVKNGALTAGYIPFGVAGSLIGEDAALFWDNVNKRLGLGTATPATSANVLKNGNSATILRVDNDTNGIAASAELQLAYNNAAQFVKIANLSPTFTTDGLRVANSSVIYSYNQTNGLRIFTYTAANLTLGTNSAANITIVSGGNTGIMETNPAARLHVQGAASAITEIIRGNATTPGDLTQWQKSDGTVYSGVNSIGGQYGKLATATKTADYTATTTDRCITANKATAIVITLPAATGSGQTISITSIGAGACTVDGAGSETINGETTQVLYLHESITVHDYGSGTWEVI